MAAASVAEVSATKPEAVKPSTGASQGSLINWSGQGLQKLGPTLSCNADIHTLILDKNQLIKLERLENYKNLMQLSVANNRLVRMMGVAKLTHLRVLNLPHNSIGYVEGLKELMYLEWLNLAGNNLKTIDQISCCISLQHLDMSDNNISQIGDISKLSSLKTLLLHGNIITSLRSAPSCLPQGLTIFSLAENEIRDLNEISFLTCFPKLEQLSIMNNPCVMATPNIPGFDYRPFIVSWCLSLKVIDGYVVSQKESLKAEWLYSQGKGRSFRPGQHLQLVQYLASVCPLTTMFGLQTAEDAKLEKILHKQRLHQRQLLYQSHANESPVSSTLNKELPITNEPYSPAHVQQEMAESERIIKKNTWVVTKSNDDHSYAIKNISPTSVQAERNISKDFYLDDIQTDEDKLNSSLLSSESTFMPVASVLSPMSPTSAELKLHGIGIDVEDVEDLGDTDLEFTKYLNMQNKQKQKNASVVLEKYTHKSADLVKTQNEDQEEDIFPIVSSLVNTDIQLDDVSSYQVSPEDNVKFSNLKQSSSPEENVIKYVSVANSLELSTDASVTVTQKKDELVEMNKAATKLQACWRGFYTRTFQSRVREARYEIRLNRMQEHIVHLTEEVEKLKKEKNEEMLQRLVQEEAVKFLWDQVKSIQEWQLSVNQHLTNIWEKATPALGILGPHELFIQSSRPNQEPSIDSSTWLGSSSEMCHQKCLQAYPDSGFHSCVSDQNTLNELQNSEKHLTETNEGFLGNSLQTVKPCEDSLSGSLSDAEIPVDHKDYCKESLNNDQNNTLLQEYLKTVEELDDSDEKINCSNRTESCKTHTAVSSEEKDILCSAVLVSQDVLPLAEEGIDAFDLNDKMAEKMTNCDSSLQTLSVRLSV
ncbi:centrosomal protein of 97 kDa [Protobothrops mucrosquamatus]|uniref:centrosomal protein of 97 kDa n=1 Tax=Protobothrops mucrosquamatus TaxID=103944 RepID=UPI0007758059|nr:centrosomal protein of 97 kDa [Protobothrops mucrosquamatus]